MLKDTPEKKTPKREPLMWRKLTFWGRQLRITTTKAKKKGNPESWSHTKKKDLV